MLILVAIPPVSAFTAELTSPSDINNVYNGDTVTIRITGLAATNTFQLNMTSSNLYTNGGMFSITSYAMPFSMTPASTLLQADNLDVANGLTLHVQGSTATVLDLSDMAAPYEIVATNDVVKQTYQNISIIGYPVTPTQAVTVDFSERGTVADAGVNPSDLTFTVNNINSGLLTIKVKDGASTVLDKTLTFRGTRPNPAPINGGDSTSGGSVSPGTKTAGVVAPAPVVAATVPGQTTTTLLLNQDGQTLQPTTIQTGTNSPVGFGLGIPQGTTVFTPPNYGSGTITVTPVPVDYGRYSSLFNTPDSILIAGLGVECTPDGTTFSNAVTITFTLSQNQWDSMMSSARGNPANVAINYYDSAKGWISLPSLKLDPATRTLSATTTHFTIYQVFVTNTTAPASTSAQTYGSLIQETPTTVSVPSVQATPAAKASPTTTPKSPFVPSIAVIAIVGLVGYFVVSRKQ
ncbi:hypothetical protein [Methanoregula sp.]|uniref:hypothetical protein n=1 Tax=Methanoregula sp. TaxID=2052170 RepID=UPI0035687785